MGNSIYAAVRNPPGAGRPHSRASLPAEMGVNIRVTDEWCQKRRRKTGRFVTLLTNLSESDILFIDEIHRLDRAVILLSCDGGLCTQYVIIGKGLRRGIDHRPAGVRSSARLRITGQITEPALRDCASASCSVWSCAYSPELCGIVERSAGILNVPMRARGARHSRLRGASRNFLESPTGFCAVVRDFAQVIGTGTIDRKVRHCASSASGR